VYTSGCCSRILTLSEKGVCHFPPIDAETKPDVNKVPPRCTAPSDRPPEIPCDFRFQGGGFVTATRPIVPIVPFSPPSAFRGLAGWMRSGSACASDIQAFHADSRQELKNGLSSLRIKLEGENCSCLLRCAPWLREVMYDSNQGVFSRVKAFVQYCSRQLTERNMAVLVPDFAGD
jgi:hypothetical protein